MRGACATDGGATGGGAVGAQRLRATATLVLLNEDARSDGGAADRGAAALRAVVHALSRPKGGSHAAAGAAGAAPPFGASSLTLLLQPALGMPRGARIRTSRSLTQIYCSHVRALPWTGGGSVGVVLALLPTSAKALPPQALPHMPRVKATTPPSNLYPEA